MSFFGVRIFTIFTFWIFFLEVLSVPDVGIRQDWFGSPHDELLSFSAIMEFNANADGSNPVTSLSDRQLVSLVSKAYNEMTNLPGNNKPGVMVLLASGNSIYFASSIKSDRGNWLGVGASENQRPQILVQAAGGARIGGSSHVREGHCGEINVMDLFFARNEGLVFQGTASRIVAWGTSKGSPPTIFNPCNNSGDRYGCWSFLRAIANPSNPNAGLNAADLININSRTTPDTSFPDGLSVQRNRNYPRESNADYEALCTIADEEYDPDHPEERKR